MTDLTQRPPRSPRVRLGGYVILPRILDKCRATLAGKNGEYHYNCPMDRRWFDYVGIDADALKAEVATGKGDWEMLQWINARARHRRTEPEIMAWSAWQENRVPGECDARDYFNDLQAKSVPKREDIHSWFDLLDADDYVSYGGRA